MSFEKSLNRSIKSYAPLFALSFFTSFVGMSNGLADHYEPNPTQTLTLNYDGIVFSPAYSRDRAELVPLRKEILRQNPSVRLDGMKLLRIEILAKSQDYSGAASIWANGQILASASIPQSTQFDSPYPATFLSSVIPLSETISSPSLLENNLTLRLEGRALRVIQIILTLTTPLNNELVCQPRVSLSIPYAAPYTTVPTFQIFNTRTGNWVGRDGLGFSTYQECQSAVASSKNGLACSYNGFHFQPFRTVDNLALGPGNAGFDLITNCNASVMSSTPELVCLWDGRRSSVPYALYSIITNEPDYRMGYNRRFRSLDACIGYLGATPFFPH